MSTGRLAIYRYWRYGQANGTYKTGLGGQVKKIVTQIICLSKHTCTYLIYFALTLCMPGNFS